MTPIQSEKVDRHVCYVHSRCRRNTDGVSRVFENVENCLFSPILFVISRKKAFLPSQGGSDNVQIWTFLHGNVEDKELPAPYLISFTI